MSMNTRFAKDSMTSVIPSPVTLEITATSNPRSWKRFLKCSTRSGEETESVLVKTTNCSRDASSSENSASS